MLKVSKGGDSHFLFPKGALTKIWTFTTSATPAQGTSTDSSYSAPPISGSSEPDAPERTTEGSSGLHLVSEHGGGNLIGLPRFSAFASGPRSARSNFLLLVSLMLGLNSTNRLCHLLVFTCNRRIADDQDTNVDCGRSFLGPFEQ